jgi:hypothetical protein
MKFRAWDHEVNRKLQLALLEERNPGWVKEEGGRILGLRGAAGESGSEPAHALFAQGKTPAAGEKRQEDDNQTEKKRAENVQWAHGNFAIWTNN